LQTLTNNKKKNNCFYRNETNSNGLNITKHDLSSKLRENKVKEMKNGKDLLDTLMKREHHSNIECAPRDLTFPNTYSNCLFPVKTEKTEYASSSIQTVNHYSSSFQINKEILNRVLFRNS
jgi:hypothetical protein